MTPTECGLCLRKVSFARHRFTQPSRSAECRPAQHSRPTRPGRSAQVCRGSDQRAQTSKPSSRELVPLCLRGPTGRRRICFLFFFFIRSWRSTGGFTTKQIHESVLSQTLTAGGSPVWHAPAAADASFSSGLVPTRLPLATRTQAVNSQDKS